MRGQRPARGRPRRRRAYLRPAARGPRLDQVTRVEAGARARAASSRLAVGAHHDGDPRDPAPTSSLGADVPAPRHRRRRARHPVAPTRGSVPDDPGRDRHRRRSTASRPRPRIGGPGVGGRGSPGSGRSEPPVGRSWPVGRSGRRARSCRVPVSRGRRPAGPRSGAQGRCVHAGDRRADPGVGGRAGPWARRPAHSPADPPSRRRPGPRRPRPRTASLARAAAGGRRAAPRGRISRTGTVPGGRTSADDQVYKTLTRARPAGDAIRVAEPPPARTARPCQDVCGAAAIGDPGATSSSDPDWAAMNTIAAARAAASAPSRAPSRYHGRRVVWPNGAGARTPPPRSVSTATVVPGRGVHRRRPPPPPPAPPSTPGAGTRRRPARTRATQQSQHRHPLEEHRRAASSRRASANRLRRRRRRTPSHVAQARRSASIPHPQHPAVAVGDAVDDGRAVEVPLIAMAWRAERAWWSSCLAPDRVLRRGRPRSADAAAAIARTDQRATLIVPAARPGRAGGAGCHQAVRPARRRPAHGRPPGP